MDSLLQLAAIVCLGSFGGRFDHVCGNLNTLYTAKTFIDVPVILLSETSLAMLLPKVRLSEIDYQYIKIENASEVLY